MWFWPCVCQPTPLVRQLTYTSNARLLSKGLEGLKILFLLVSSYCRSFFPPLLCFPSPPLPSHLTLYLMADYCQIINRRSFRLFFFGGKHTFCLVSKLLCLPKLCLPIWAEGNQLGEMIEPPVSHSKQNLHGQSVSSSALTVFG